MVDKILFRQVCSMFATGVTVVTTGREGNFHGMTANAFAVGVSLEPTLVLVCLDRNSRTCALLDDTGAFTINILSEEQQEEFEKFDQWAEDYPHDFQKQLAFWVDRMPGR